MTVLTAASPMLSDVTPSSSATAIWTMRRSYELRGPISCGAHLPELCVLVSTKPLAIDDHATLFAKLTTERRVDDRLQRAQRVAALEEQHFRAFAFDVDPDRTIRVGLGLYLRRGPHGRQDVGDEGGDLF